MTSSEESIGRRLRRLRLERGLSQRQLAAPGVSYAYISRIEAGTRRPSVRALRKLAPKLGVSVEYLETGSTFGAADAREMRLGEAELELRLAEDPARAEAALRGVLAEALEAGDGESAQRARVGLGLAAAHRGDHAEAIAQLGVLLGSSEVSPITHPDVFSALGRAYVAAGMTEKAVELWERCLAEVAERAPDDTAAYVRFATYLSYPLSDLGQFARARGMLRAALDRAGELVDPYTRVRLYWSQARLASAEGRPEAALANIRRAIALLEVTEDTLQLARAHLLCAEIMTFENQAEEAGPHLELAQELLGRRADAEDLYWLRAEQARRAASLGLADEAIVRAREALALIGDADPAERGTAHWALAEGLAIRGEVDEADASFRQAVELLAQERRWREAARVCRSWGRVLRESGRETQAFAALERASELAARLGLRRSRALRQR